LTAQSRKVEVEAIFRLMAIATDSVMPLAPTANISVYLDPQNQTHKHPELLNTYAGTG
jgi:hypothetical protein